MKCLICGSPLQAALVENHYYDVQQNGSVKLQAEPNSVEVRVFCENDCQAKPGAEVCSASSKMEILHALMRAQC